MSEVNLSTTELPSGRRILHTEKSVMDRHGRVLIAADQEIEVDADGVVMRVSGSPHDDLLRAARHLIDVRENIGTSTVNYSNAVQWLRDSIARVKE